MTGTPTAIDLGTIMFDPREPTDVGWSRVRDLARTGGLAPLPAARLALAATALLDEADTPTAIHLARVADQQSARVEAVIAGQPGPGGLLLPSDLVDASFQRTSSAGAPEQVLSVAAEAGPVPNRPSWTALSDSAAHASSTRQLLAVALVAASRQPAHPGVVDAETAALRLELDETNRGMLALHAELSVRQEQLERARAAAERAGQVKAAFLANMSHEIRSPMNAVVGFTGLLLETALTSEQIEYADALQIAGRHLLGVIDDILDLSKIESGRLELEDIPFDLYACVEDAIGIVALKAAEKRLALAALFAPGIPAVIRGDPLRLGQILVNLLANAVKFTSRGVVTVEVDHQPHTPSSQRLIFRVKDTGSGIPTEALGRLFVPFAQADASTTRSHGGTGLGLSICRQLAEQMGGTITVASTVGRGTTFTCTIRTETETGAAELAAGDGGLLAGVRVLVISGSGTTVETIRRHLTSWGAEVITGSTLDEAADRAGRRADVDLVLVDVEDWDAVTPDLVSQAGPRGPAPTIAITALAGRTARGHANRLAVSTPVRRALLRKVVLRALGRGIADRSIGLPVAGAAPAASAGPRPVRRVLYVDDDPMMVRLVDRILGSDPSVVVRSANDGESALRLAAEQRPHLILLDLHLAGVGGEELLRQIRADPRTRQIPVVIVSGDTAQPTIERLTRLGAADYLTKPFRAARLRELVDGATRGEAPAGPAAVPTP